MFPLSNPVLLPPEWEMRVTTVTEKAKPDAESESGNIRHCLFPGGNFFFIISLVRPDVDAVKFVHGKIILMDAHMLRYTSSEKCFFKSSL